jgi:flagellar basal-body rod modification protein FlgD
MASPVNNTNSAEYNRMPTMQKKNLGQQDFLQLMVAQVKNQDPMSPQANGEFMGQLAQFSTNDGIGSMQKSMEKLVSSLQSNETMQASSLVGHNVLVNSNKINLAAEGGAKAAVEVPAGMKEITASIYSESGALIKTISLGQPAEGIHHFEWDGFDTKGEKMPAGNYDIKLQGTYQGQEYPLPVMSNAKVESIRISQYGKGVILNVSGIGDVSLNDVRQIQNA